MLINTSYLHSSGVRTQKSRCVAFIFHLSPTHPTLNVNAMTPTLRVSRALNDMPAGIIFRDYLISGKSVEQWKFEPMGILTDHLRSRQPLQHSCPTPHLCTAPGPGITNTNHIPGLVTVIFTPSSSPLLFDCSRLPPSTNTPIATTYIANSRDGWSALAYLDDRYTQASPLMYTSSASGPRPPAPLHPATQGRTRPGHRSQKSHSLSSPTGLHRQQLTGDS